MESNIFNKFKKKISAKESSIEDDVTVELDLSEKTAILNLSDELKEQKKSNDSITSHGNIQHKSLVLKALQKFLPNIYNKLNLSKKNKLLVSEVSESGGKKKTKIKIIHIIIALGIGFMAIEGYIFEEDVVVADKEVTKRKVSDAKNIGTTTENKENSVSVKEQPVKTAKEDIAHTSDDAASDDSIANPDSRSEVESSEPQTSDVFNLESELEVLKKKEVEKEALPTVEEKPAVTVKESESLSDMFEKDDVATENNKDLEKSSETSMNELDQGNESSDEVKEISANDPERALKADDSINVEIVDDQLTDDVMSDLTDNSSFSENVLKKLEKKLATKKDENLSEPVLDMNEESSIDYAMSGRGLVYNCSGGHWACVNTKVYSECVKSHKTQSESSSVKTCVPKLIYDNDIDCENVQQYNVSHGVDVDFCN